MKETESPSLPLGAGGPVEGPKFVVPSIEDGTKQHLSTPLRSSNEGISTSMNLIDESANHLYGLMKEVRPRDANDINAVCNIAKQLQNFMRIKLDVIKLHEQMSGVKNGSKKTDRDVD